MVRYRRRKRRFRRKRPFSRRRSYKRAYKKLKLRLGGFGNSKIVKLRYTSAFDLTVAELMPFADKKYRANSIYDPDYAAGGHQPLNFDTYAALYHKYTVLGAKITMKYMLKQPAVAACEPIVVGIVLNDNIDEPPANASIAKLIENGRFKWRIEANSNNSTSGIPKVMTRYFSAKKFFKVRDVLDNHQLGAEVTTNPAMTAYFDIIAGRVVGNSGTLATIAGLITIDYIVKFRILKDQDLS